jgi:hypothetical protein
MSEGNMISRLRKVDAAERIDIIEKLYAKNILFFKERYPQIVALFRKVKCPYHIDLTGEFLSIIQTSTGLLSHPKIGLDLFSETLGDWVHDTWVDLFNFRVVAPERYPVHHQPIKDMHRGLMSRFPDYLVAFAQGKINLKELQDDRRFSPPVVFLGVFHGLQIDFFLSRTEVTSLLLIEPEPERFEVSCYFLDYEALYNRFEHIQISVGEDVDAQPIRDFFSSYRVSPQMWARILPAYASSQHMPFLESFKMHQTTLASVIYPVEFEMLGIQHVLQNIALKTPLLSRFPKLSRKSKIALVATGPSLDNDLQWLKKNQDKLLVFAVASAVSALNAHGIRVDIQFTLEVNMLVQTAIHLEMARDIPVIAPAKINKQTSDYFGGNIYICATDDKAMPFEFTAKVPLAAPSTTNFALSFACLCEPKEIYLLGCDFGYHSLDKHHSASSSYKDNCFGNYAEKMSQMMVASNFTTRGMTQSNPFLSHTRLVVENAIRTLGTNISFFNLSDGAKVEGARSKRSKRIRLSFYKEKGKDIRRILDVFIPPQEGVNYHKYSIEGQFVVEQLKEEVLRTVTLDDFSWATFVSAIDRVVYDSIKKCQLSDSDLRPDVFSRILIDLLCTWYSTIIFFDNEQQVEQVYREGLNLLTEAMDVITWVEDKEFIGELLQKIPSKIKKGTPYDMSFSQSMNKVVLELIQMGRSRKGDMEKDMSARILIDHLASWYSKILMAGNSNMQVQRNHDAVTLLKENINRMIKRDYEVSQETVAFFMKELKSPFEEST